MTTEAGTPYSSSPSTWTLTTPSDNSLGQLHFRNSLDGLLFIVVGILMLLDGI